MLQYLGQRQKKSGRSISNLITDHWILITALAPALTSCMGVYEGGFECPPGEGVGCKSISEVNLLVNQGDLPKEQNDFYSTTCKPCNPNPDFPNNNSEKAHIWYSPSALGSI